jgi:predicted RNA binding protein YcfA (HicA-like mRNA interferase family)
MKSVSGKELARLLECHGWTLMRVNGSHHIYGKPGSIVRLSVPLHGTMH